MRCRIAQERDVHGYSYTVGEDTQIIFRSGAAGKCELPGIGSATRDGFHRCWRLKLRNGQSLELRRTGIPRWKLRLASETSETIGGYTQAKLLLAGGPLSFAGRNYQVVTAKRRPTTLELLEGSERVAVGQGNPRESSVQVVREDTDPKLLLFFCCLVDQYAIIGNGAMRPLRAIFELLSWW